MLLVVELGRATTRLANYSSRRRLRTRRTTSGARSLTHTRTQTRTSCTRHAQLSSPCRALFALLRATGSQADCNPSASSLVRLCACAPANAFWRRARTHLKCKRSAAAGAQLARGFCIGKSGASQAAQQSSATGVIARLRRLQQRRQP